MEGTVLAEQTCSSSSTEEYSQEPFELYANRVLEIIKAIVPDITEEPVIYRMKGGSYNRVTGITTKTQAGTCDYVFRTPRFLEAVDRSAAILHYLHKHNISSIPAPSIIAEQLFPSGLPEPNEDGCVQLVTSDLVNRKEAFLLLEKLPGSSLFIEYNKFSHFQKVEFARCFANLMADIFRLDVPQSIGKLTAAKGSGIGVQSLVENQDALSNGDSCLIKPDTSIQPDIALYLEGVFKHMQAIEIRSNPIGLYGPRVCNKLLTSIQNLLKPRSAELSNLCYTVFCHGDLAGRNILVTPPVAQDEAWEISGVLDWDDCRALPPVCAYWSPNWLWMHHDKSDDKSLAVGWEFDEDPSAGLPNDEQREIKDAFVEAIEARIPSYMRIVELGREIKIKQMLYIAEHGISHPVTHDILDDIFVAAGIPRLWDPRAPSLGGLPDKQSIASSTPSTISTGSEVDATDEESISGTSEAGFEKTIDTTASYPQTHEKPTRLPQPFSSASNAHNMDTNNTCRDAQSQAPPSPTSTVVYEHLPFAQYQDRIVEIVQTLFPDATESIKVQHMKGGSFNRVTSILVTTGGRAEEYVYRTPRLPSPVNHTAAMLRFLAQQSQVPTPKVFVTGSLTVQVDQSKQENYIIMDKLPGDSLALVYADLSLNQKISIASQVATMMADIFALPVPSTIGKLKASEESHLISQPFIHDQLLPSQTSKRHLPVSEGDLEAHSDTIDWLLKLFDYMRRAKLLEDPDNVCNSLMYRKLVACVRRLLVPRAADLEGLDYTVFVHADLAARNLLVAPFSEDSETWKITGVLDWDECLALPPLCAYWCPNWLWHEGSDMIPEKFRLGWEFNADPDLELLSEAESRIKAAFVETIEARIPNYMKIVKLGFDCKIKEMVYIAQHGIFNPFVDDIFDDICRAAGIPGLFDSGATTPVSRRGSVAEYASTIASHSDASTEESASGHSDEQYDVEVEDPRPSNALSIPMDNHLTMESTMLTIQPISNTSTSFVLVGSQEGANSFTDGPDPIVIVIADRVSTAGSPEHLDAADEGSQGIPGCYATCIRWNRRRRARRRETLRERRQKIVAGVGLVGNALKGLLRGRSSGIDSDISVLNGAEADKAS